MLLQAGWVEVLLVTGFENAYKLISFILFIMGLEMLLEIGAGCELLATELAVVRLVTGVYSQMPDQVGNL